MRKLFLILLFSLFEHNVYAVSATVDYVLDGDTFAAAVNVSSDIAITVRVRLINIDAPELKGACDEEIELANRAKQRLATLLPSGIVIDLQNIKDDEYLGRIDANVILSDGRDVGDILMYDGLARKYISGERRRSWCEN